MGLSIVKMERNDFIVGTWDMSKNIGVEHRMLTRTLEKYRSDFENELGFVASQRQRIANKKGGQIEEYLLDEPQSMYLLTLLSNMPTVRKFKLWLTKEFFKQRKMLSTILAQKQNAEWLDKRNSGKIDRRLETDVIKEFIEYAKSQGSRSADKYYMILTKMENNALFHLDLLEQKFPNIRDLLQGFQLHYLQMADRIIGRAIKDEMKKITPYKEIYQISKDRVEKFAELIGKSPIYVCMDSKLFIEGKK